MDSWDAVLSLFATTVTKARNDATFVSKARANLTFKMQDAASDDVAHEEPARRSPPGQGCQHMCVQEACGDTAVGGDGQVPDEAAPGARPAEEAKPQAPLVQIFKTQAMHPTALVFDLPADFQQGEASVWMEGPHGPILAPVPPGARPGDFIQVHIGPKRSAVGPRRQAAPARVADENTDPQDAREYEAPAREDSAQALKEGGAPPEEPVLMVRVPEGAGPGDWVSFAAPEDGGSPTAAEAARMAQVPDGAPEGSYFEVPLGLQCI